MKHKIIKTENYLLIVDDSEIKEGNTYIRIDTELLFSSLKGSNPHIVEKYCKKILAHLPLNNSPILDGVDLLPLLEQPKMPIEFECEMEEITIGGFVDGIDEAITIGKKNVPKTTTNSQGLTQWVGKYIFD
jgi:hypothetical protein